MKLNMVGVVPADPPAAFHGRKVVAPLKLAERAAKAASEATFHGRKVVAPLKPACARAPA